MPNDLTIHEKAERAYEIWLEQWKLERPERQPPTKEQFVRVCDMLQIHPETLFGMEVSDAG